MSSTPVTIEISTALHTALKAVVGDDVYVYARGVATDAEGAINPNVTAIKRKCPMVDIIPIERIPLGHASALQAYPVRIRVVTYGPSDPWQVSLYTIADKVSKWLTSNPTLTLATVHCDAVVALEEPDVGETGLNETLQYLEWRIEIKTRNGA